MRLLATISLLTLLSSQQCFSQNTTTVELPQERDMYSRTYVMETGRKEKLIYNNPVNYLKDGEWLPIQTDLILSGSSQWAYTNESNAIRSRFPSSVSGSNEIELEVGGNVIRLSTVKEMVTSDGVGNLTAVQKTLNSNAPMVAGNTIVYDEVYNGIDDGYIVQEGTVKNELLLTSIPAELSTTTDSYYGFTEELILPTGWEIRALMETSDALKSCDLEIVNEQGEQVLIIPAPIIFDMMTDATDGSGSIQGSFKYSNDNGVWKLTTLVPVFWLNNPFRAYPVTIDPTVTLAGNTGGWQSQNNYVNNPGYVFIGVCCGNMEHRAWIKWDVSSIPDNACVTKVELQVYVNGVGGSSAELVHAYDMMATTSTGLFGPYSGILPAVYADQGNGYYTSFTITGTGYYGYYDLGPNAVSDVMDMMNSYNWYQVALIFDNEPSTNWKRLTGTMCNLRITYDNPPCVVLPVEFVDFETKCENNRAQLTWKTVSEQNNDYFTIWRSTDGEHFSEVGTVDGKGSTQDIHEYTWTSNVRGDEMAYYKVSQTDFNGATEFFETKVFEGCDGLVPAVFMSNGQVVVEGEEIYQVIITDYLGRQVLISTNELNSERIELALSDNGTFLVSVTHHNGEVTTERVIK